MISRSVNQHHCTRQKLEYRERSRLPCVSSLRSLLLPVQTEADRKKALKVAIIDGWFACATSAAGERRAN